MLTVLKGENKYAAGRYKGTLRTVSTKDSERRPLLIQRHEDCHLDFRVVTEGVEIGAGWTSENNASRTAA